MVWIDLNSDVGESFGAYRLGRDEEIIACISSANIACGFHAGDALEMERAVGLCKRYGVGVGAHPGLPDLAGFGRREMKISAAEAKAYLKYQLGALSAFCLAQQVPLIHVKPHGALYNMAAQDYSLARALAEAVWEVDRKLIFLALSGSEMLRAGADVGLNCASEVFADRAYNADGSLVARGLPGAMIHDADECAQRILRMVKEGKVTAISGEDIALTPQSICVHGDTPQAVTFVQNIRASLLQEGIELSGLARLSR